MDTKKLDKWADLLLDTGKSNNLINFKDTRASTVEVLLPSSDVLFEKVDGTASFEAFDPKIVEEDDDSEESYAPERLQIEVSEKTDASGSKAAFLAQYSGKIKRQNQILLYNAATNPLTAVKNIDKKAREFIEENGVNVAYMAFGFVHWKESAASNYVFRAPILLVPIQLEQASAVEPYFIKSAEDDIIVNPTFSYKMDAEHGVKLPEYNDEGLTAYLEKVKRLVAKLQWTVTAECKIGIFSFLKINMYRDLKDNAKAILANQNVRQLLGEPTSAEKLYGDKGTAGSVIDPLIELHSVVDADSSQIEAIEMAKTGKSFVLQGPPGTGKSQTITNIIAECLGDGKKVLFVSEKLAALNVVYDKLKQAGLAEFCLQLHSHKANKKDVIADICHTLRTGKSAVSSKADAEIAIKEKAQHQLDAYAVELHKLRPVIEKSLYQLYESYAAFRSTPDVEFPISQLASKGESYLIETAALLEQYTDYTPSIGYDYRKNSWYGYINQDTSYQSKNEVKGDLSAVSQFLQVLIPLQQEISEKYKIQCTSVEDAQLWNSFFGFAATSKLITPSLLDRERFDAVNSALHKLQAQSADIMAARSVLGAVFDDDIYKLDGTAYHKKLTKQFGGIFSRLFNAEYKQLITDLRLCKKDGKKPAYNEAVSMTERLAYYQQKTLEFVEAEAPIKAFLGEAYHGVETEWDYVAEQMSALWAMFSSSISFGTLEHYDDFTSERDIFADYHQKLDETFAVCSADTFKRVDGYFDRAILNTHSAPCNLVLARLADCLSEMDKLDTIEAEDNDEETGDVTDFESILDLCSTSMQQLRLRWHYRSRYEQLITFSNKNFYDSDLVTFPSSKVDAPGIGVDYYHVDGVFDRKAHTNRKEAEFIVDLIYQNIEKYPNRSLGVVAFSVAQQDLIDKLLSKRRQSTPEKEYFFKNDGKEPFFIKNLETVQGDERDTIIFSIAYGIDAQGRLLHNFGPLNRVGGERRLNVAVTRAKCNVQLVSSMHYTDIDLKHTSAEGAKLLREYLDYAENGSVALQRAISVSPFEQFDSDFELEVCDYLRSKEFAVDTQVGCSGFRIDLGLKLPDSSDYVLAIECDGATYHSSKNARDRDRLRQEILERMGWKFYRIWSTDWFRNKSVEQLRLLEAAADAVQNPTKAEVKSVDSQPTETFEEVAAEKHFEFPAYKAADFFEVCQHHHYSDFKVIVKEILELEAPLSEDLFLKRIVWYFDREKVTNVVQRAYEQQMYGYQRYGIIRRNGFLYLDNGKEIQFRGPGDVERDIKQIAPEELAAGMFEILKQNVTADKSGLYRSLAAQCGVTRVGKAINEAMDAALNVLSDRIIVDGEQVSIK